VEGDVRTDPILRLWVEEANAGGANETVTLWVAGTIVTGTLAAAYEYLEDLAASWSKAPGGEKLAANYSALALQEKERVDLLGGERDDLPASYIHLRNAKVLPAGANTPSSGDGSSWRGRLDRVDGFSFGRYPLPPDSRE